MESVALGEQIDGLDDVVGVGHDDVLQERAEGTRHVLDADSLNGGIGRVKKAASTISATMYDWAL